MAHGFAHDLVFRALWRFGYELKRMDATGWSAENLRKDGLNPATIIDVGVGTGTPGLHDAYPKAHHVFIEPLAEFEPNLKHLVDRYGGEYHLLAVGDVDGSQVMHVDRRIPMQSSLARMDGIGDRPTDERSVDVTRLDTLARRSTWPEPYGIKVDTEGYECQVVRGATEVLEKAVFLIAELSVEPGFLSGCSFADFIALMDDRGFRLCDILSSPRSKQKELIQIDAMFRPKLPA